MQKPAGDNGGPQLVASLVFLPGLSRAGSSAQQLALNSTAQLAHMEIQLEPRDEYPRYRVSLQRQRRRRFGTEQPHQAPHEFGLCRPFDLPS
jgi:hypothetical protein